MPDAVGIVLAAGKGTRMKSRLPKAVHPLCGKPMGRYTVDLCRAVGVERVLVVVGHEAEAVRAALGEDVEYVEQSPQRGTGDAVRQAAAALPGFEGTLLVLQADTPLATPEMVAAMLQQHRETGAAATLLSAVLEDPARYGRVVRVADGRVQRIVEFRDAPPEVAAIREINSGTYCFEAGWLFAALEEIRPDNRQAEYYLTDAIGIMAERGARVEAFTAPAPAAALGINDRVELAQAAAVVRGRILRELMLAGVSIVDPATTYIDATVRIEPDTVIHPMTLLAGRTVIGSGCEIGPQARITDCTLGEGVQAQYCVLAESEVGEGTRIGPFAQLRPGCRVGRRCKIGNFVELKKAVVEDKVSIGHLAYMGDVFIGTGTNIGAGAITCNYDGRAKHVTQIGKNSFIGTHATLVAPVTIGDGAYVAAGSPVTEDVEPEALVIARSRQTVKPGWARKRREEGR
jgi:bifunctional UDP-N-acetylglucosamine pyrophosphorylase/glucosamine-1-phosphate N-acetyltransferase